MVIKSWCGGGDFLHPSRLALGPNPASYIRGIGSFPWVKQLQRGVNHPPPPGVEVKEGVELYLYSPSMTSWQVIG